VGIFFSGRDIDKPVFFWHLENSNSLSNDAAVVKPASPRL